MGKPLVIKNSCCNNNELVKNFQSVCSIIWLIAYSSKDQNQVQMTLMQQRKADESDQGLRIHMIDCKINKHQQAATFYNWATH